MRPSQVTLETGTGIDLDEDAMLRQPNFSGREYVLLMGRLSCLEPALDGMIVFGEIERIIYQDTVAISVQTERLSDYSICKRNIAGRNIVQCTVMAIPTGIIRVLFGRPVRDGLSRWRDDDGLCQHTLSRMHRQNLGIRIGRV